jgi:L-asparaginase
VLEAYGAGNFPIAEELGRSLLPLFREARARGVPVVVISQAYRNGVDLGMYESGAAALEAGAIGGADLTPSAALVKLMLGLVEQPDWARLERFITTPVAGELTPPRR